MNLHIHVQNTKQENRGITSHPIKTEKKEGHATYDCHVEVLVSI